MSLLTPITGTQCVSNSLSAPNTKADLTCDVLIIGAGLAGLTTALSLPTNKHIIVLAKEDVQACSSYYAQGGIAAVIDQNDSVEEHVSDTLVAGDGLCNTDTTTQILGQGSQAIAWLLSHNVPFTIDNDNDNSNTLHLTKEGGHGRRRVAHADDATGRYIMQALLNDVTKASNITLLTHHEALRLLIDIDADVNVKTDSCTNHKYCKGALVVPNIPCEDMHKPALPFYIHSQAVVLASGGLGQLFGRATAPSVCVGDGIMMAWEAGCRLANLEFVQFHPTGLADTPQMNKAQTKAEHQPTNGRNFLISEALRGEGAYLLDPVSKQRFMPHYDYREELAPRDIVARAIAKESDDNGLGYVHLDISHQPAHFIKTHFPDIYTHCLSVGIDITTDPIPVAPTAHYTCGGVMTTAQGQTDIKGLYAAGEVAHTGLHGANRLASNSLLECVVVGHAVAQHIPHYIADNTYWVTSDDITPAGLATANVILPANIASNATNNVTNNIISNKAIKFRLSTFGFGEDTPTYTTQLRDLKQLMTQTMGIRRTEQNLLLALQQIEKWRQNGIQSSSNLNNASHLSITANVATFDIASYRWQRLLNLTTLMLHSALSRIESRGGHYRDDYPILSDDPMVSIVLPMTDRQDMADATASATLNNAKSEDKIAV